MITKRDLEAFMGQDAPQDDTPLARMRQDIASFLKASMSPQDRVHFVNPFQDDPGACCSTKSSLAIGRDMTPFLAEISDSDSDSSYDSEFAPSERAGNKYLLEALILDVDRIFAIMTELMVIYDLETCFACIREKDGERLFVVHRLVWSEMWRTHIFSSNLSQLLVDRRIPTIVSDITKDPRFLDASDPRSQLGRSFVQAPIGWTDDGGLIGVINLVGAQALSRASLQDYDALMHKADEIASLAVARGQC